MEEFILIHNLSKFIQRSANSITVADSVNFEKYCICLWPCIWLFIQWLGFAWSSIVIITISWLWIRANNNLVLNAIWTFDFDWCYFLDKLIFHIIHTLILGWCRLNTFWLCFGLLCSVCSVIFIWLKACICSEFYSFHRVGRSHLQTSLNTSCMGDYIRFQMNLKLKLQMEVQDRR